MTSTPYKSGDRPHLAGIGRMGATTVEVEAGHLVMISHPDDAAGLVITAAEACAAASMASMASTA